MKGLSLLDKLNWIKCFGDTADTDYPEIPDKTPIEFIKEREEFDVNITEEKINKMKDNNGTI